MSLIPSLTMIPLSLERIIYVCWLSASDYSSSSLLLNPLKSSFTPDYTSETILIKVTNDFLLPNLKIISFFYLT